MKSLRDVILGGLLVAGFVAAGTAWGTRDIVGDHYAFTTTETATIAASGTVSGEVDLGDYTLVGFQVATMSGTALSFQCASATAGTFVELRDGTNSPISFTITDDRFYSLDNSAIGGCRFIKLVSNATETSARTITLTLGR